MKYENWYMKYENWYHQTKPFKWISNKNTHTHKEKKKCEEKFNKK